MRVQGSKFLITGAASGIGKALALEVCRQGGDVTALDLQSDKLSELGKEAEGLPGRLVAVRCDVGSDGQQKDAFQDHMRRFGRLDCAVMCAGIQERACMFTAEEDREWQMCLDVDLRAAMVGCRLAVRAMQQSKTPGVIVNVASAAGVYPAPLMPVYSTAAPRLLQKHGIRMSCLCPQFVDTPFLDPQKFPDAATREKILRTTLGAARYGGAARLLRVEEAAAALLSLLDDDIRAGTVRVLYQDGRCADLFQLQDRDLYPAAAALRPDAAALPQLRSWAQAALPSSYSKVQVRTLSSDFQQATRIVVQDLPTAISDGHLLVRRAYAGVNASDINYTSGWYHASVKEAQDQLPFDAGMEAVGVVARAGPDTKLAEGSAVATMTFGGFAEFAVVPERHVLPVPTPDPRMLALLTSGLTASIALEQAGRMRHGEVVLVTAAAGGTGQFAVQLAKRAGNTVVATCSSAAKAAMLRRLGADFVVNYREQNLRQVLKQHFPKGVDLVYESVGGDMFSIAANALARRGRLIVIGMISQYAAGWPRGSYPGLAEKLLAKSASVVGFFLPHYTRLFRRHLAELVELWRRGKLEVEVDSSELFVGVRQVAAAVQHLHSGRSQGKVVVQMSPTAPPGVAPHARSAL